MSSNCLKLNKLILNQKRMISSFCCHFKSNSMNQMIDRKSNSNEISIREMHSFLSTNLLKNKTFDSLKTISN